MPYSGDQDNRSPFAAYTCGPLSCLSRLIVATVCLAPLATFLITAATHGRLLAFFGMLQSPMAIPVIWIPLFIAIYQILFIRKFRVELYEDKIRVSGVFTQHEMKKKHISHAHRIRWHTRLISSSPKVRDILFQNPSLEHMGIFKEWIKPFEDKFENTKQDIEKSIPLLFRAATHVISAIFFISILALAGRYVDEHSVKLITGISFLTIPLALIFDMNRHRNDAYALFPRWKTKNSGTALWLILGVITLGITFMASPSIRLFSASPMIVYGLAGLCIGYIYLSHHHKQAALPTFNLGCIFIAFWLACGALLLNATKDTKPPDVHEIKILDLRIKKGRRHTTHKAYLVYEDVSPETYNLSKDLFIKASSGQKLCITIHNGILGFQWYEINTCSG